MNPEEIVSRFMFGYCYALAYELEPILDCPVEILFATRPGEGRIPDPLHVYLRVNDKEIFDIKGKRSFAQMTKDFEGIVQLIKRHDHDVIGLDTELLDDRDNLFDLYDFDPAGLDKVNTDVLTFLGEAINSFSKQMSSVHLHCESGYER